jgi:DNA-directed RNA polymerase specialized sigma24 family protein
MPVFETQEELERWMRRVLLNGARDRIRAEARRIRRESQAPIATATEHDRDSLAELNVRLRAIDKESAQLLRRRYDLGWTLEQIGRELGLRPGAVDGRIRRILKKLRGDAGSQQ